MGRVEESHAHYEGFPLHQESPFSNLSSVQTTVLAPYTRRHEHSDISLFCWSSVIKSPGNLNSTAASNPLENSFLRVNTYLPTGNRTTEHLPFGYPLSHMSKASLSTLALPIMPETLGSILPSSNFTCFPCRQATTGQLQYRFNPLISTILGTHQSEGHSFRTASPSLS